MRDALKEERKRALTCPRPKSYKKGAESLSFILFSSFMARSFSTFFFSSGRALLLVASLGALALGSSPAWAQGKKKGGSPEPVLKNAARAVQMGEVPRLPSVLPPSKEAVDEQINRGITFLLESQNEDGSWGGHDNTLSSSVLCPLPGGALAFQSAVTSLDVMGIMACAQNDPRVQASLDKAEEWLLASLPKLRRTDTDTMLNVWGHSYGIRALCMLSERVSPESQTFASLKAECKNQIARLMVIADGGGGWGYYEFDSTTARPNGLPTSFCTSTVLSSLKEAERCFGLKGEAKIVNKAVKFLYNQRTPAGTYVYSYTHRRAPTGLINRPMGSLARTPSGNLALYNFKHKAITVKEIEDGLDWLWARGGWLDMARKRPIPHEGYAANAGYFFYYGYFYASENINLLPEEKRPRHASFLSHAVLPLQEKDGSWWDFPLYNYHKPYGTGYALFSLAQARGALYGSKFVTPLLEGEVPVPVTPLH